MKKYLWHIWIRDSEGTSAECYFRSKAHYASSVISEFEKTCAFKTFSLGYVESCHFVGQLVN